MFCPKCRLEYEENISKCPDCDELLVESLPTEEIDSGPSYEDWIPLARLSSQQYADMVLEAIRSKDIPAVILSSSGHFGQTGQAGISAFHPIGGSFTLLVPQEFVVDADNEAKLVLGDEWEKSKLVDISEE